MTGMPAGHIETFRAKLTPGNPDDCWEWPGSKNSHGYGHINRQVDGKQKTIATHRIAYALKNGPIPPGLVILHSCDNPACCNPNHLSAGTHQDNTDDKMAKGRHKVVTGHDHYESRFTPDQIQDIRADKATQEAIAAFYGVSQSTISRIKAGVCYK